MVTIPRRTNSKPDAFTSLAMMSITIIAVISFSASSYVAAASASASASASAAAMRRCRFHQRHQQSKRNNPHRRPRQPRQKTLGAFSFFGSIPPTSPETSTRSTFPWSSPSPQPPTHFRPFAGGNGASPRVAAAEGPTPLMDRPPKEILPSRSKRRVVIPPIAASVALSAAIFFVALWLRPSPCFALSIPSPSRAVSNARTALVVSLDRMSRAGAMGMILYAVAFLIWTMTVGITTPVETACGMAFPLSKAIPLSIVGKIGGALGTYVLTKYVLTDWVRAKIMTSALATEGEDGCEVVSSNCSVYGKWMIKIDQSFESNPLGVALIWRFGPLPEFVKNIGPALSPKSRTRHQILATFIHGVPFTLLWSFVGHELGIVARGGKESVAFKRIVGGISWVGLVVSPTLFGWWVKSLGEKSGEKR